MKIVIELHKLDQRMLAEVAAPVAFKKCFHGFSLWEVYLQGFFRWTVPQLVGPAKTLSVVDFNPLFRAYRCFLAS